MGPIIEIEGVRREKKYNTFLNRMKYEFGPISNNLQISNRENQG